MKYVVSTLDGALLDAAVEKAEGRMPDHGWDAPGMERTAAPLPGQCDPYSTDWAFGGPIIERERIISVALPSGQAAAFIPERMQVSCESIPVAFSARGLGQIDTAEYINGQVDIRLQAPRVFMGGTHLVAAMRAYVASKFGDEVDL